MSSALNIASAWGLKGPCVFALLLICLLFLLGAELSPSSKLSLRGASLPSSRLQWRTGVETMGQLWWWQRQMPNPLHPLTKVQASVPFLPLRPASEGSTSKDKETASLTQGAPRGPS